MLQNYQVTQKQKQNRGKMLRIIAPITDFSKTHKQSLMAAVSPAHPFLSNLAAVVLLSWCHQWLMTLRPAAPMPPFWRSAGSCWTSMTTSSGSDDAVVHAPCISSTSQSERRSRGSRRPTSLPAERESQPNRASPGPRDREFQTGRWVHTATTRRQKGRP